MSTQDKFILESPYKPTGDQPEAIAKLVEGVNKGAREQTIRPWPPSSVPNSVNSSPATPWSFAAEAALLG